MTVRVGQTRASRERIVGAARALFLRRGYAGTTVDAIAQRAGCSPQTIYNVVGGKAAVLKAVYDVMLAGDAAPVPMVERPSVRAVMAAPDGRTCLALYARTGREIYERIAPLVPIVLAEAAGGDRTVRRFVETIEAERARGTAGIAGHVAQRFGLRPGLSVGDAADILWTLTSPDVAHRMVRRRKWTLDRFEAWLGDTMADALLGR